MTVREDSWGARARGRPVCGLRQPGARRGHAHTKSVVLTLQAGQSTTINKSLHFDGLPARPDIIVAIDTTGSMGTALANAKADAVQICTDVKAAIPGARFAAVEFQDYPIDPYGNPAIPPTSCDTLGYTRGCATFSAGIAAMTLGIGGDLPEANNRVHFEAYSDSALLGSRDPLATRFLVMLADKSLTAPRISAAVRTRARSATPAVTASTKVAGGTTSRQEVIAGLNADDHTLLYISYIPAPTPLPCHEALAAATGGDAVAEEDAQDIGALHRRARGVGPVHGEPRRSAPGMPARFRFYPAPPYGPLTGESTMRFVETITAPTLCEDYTCTVRAVMNPGGPTTAVSKSMSR